MPGAWRDCKLSQRCPGLHPRKRRVLPIDVFSEVFPDVLGHFEKYFDDLGIELSSGPELDFLARDLK